MTTRPAKGGPHTGAWALVLGALGVVFGDIGTSPLYALHTVFTIDDGAVTPTPEDVYGVISLVVWSVTLIVSVKYVTFVLRADNEGEGGILSLAHLIRQHVSPGSKRFGLVMLLGILGASLFYGDSLITPAISVLSAVEGLEVVNPAFANLVLPIGLVIITLLFFSQRHGTEKVGRFFGPVMVVWFLVLGVLGVPHIIADPSVLGALLPTHAVAFFVSHPFIAFIAMGAVVLTITGAEALYADMGHFGRGPISRAWFLLVFPCLMLNYLGQAQLILHNPKEIANPFFDLAPGWAQLPLVVLATLATVIASQAVISGAFSVSRQAERLGCLPRLTVRQTSEHEGGQIYVPAVNWLLFAGVIVLMLAFEASARLASAYGMAVTATLLLETTLFCVYVHSVRRWKPWQTALVALGFGVVELVFFLANVSKILHGGWLPLTIAAVIATTMLTWRKGVELVTRRRVKIEGSLMQFLDDVHTNPPQRVPGLAVFLHPNKATTPLALRENVAFNHVLHEQVVIVSAVSMNVPHVAPQDRFSLDDLEDPYDNIWHVTLRFGFADEQNVPAGLALAAEQGLPIDLGDVTYFVSRMSLRRSTRPGMPQWRKRIVAGLANNAANPAEYFQLPIERVVLMGTAVEF